MKAETKKTMLVVIATAVSTAVVIFILLYLFMPTLGPQIMHPMMSGRMNHGQMMGGNQPIPELDTATSKPSDNGLYQVSFASNLDPISLNQMHSWVLTVQTPDGEPVENATIQVDGGMPQHGHGLPTRPQVTEELGDGAYLVEGLRFQMGGWWEVTFSITNTAGETDSVTFNLILEG
jgi:hypothetical protein